MTNLISILEETTLTRPGRPSYLAPAHSPHTGTTEARRTGLKRTLIESVRSRDTVTLSPSEARMVLRLLEREETDPFVDAGDITVDDLQGVGINASQDDIQGSNGDGAGQRQATSSRQGGGASAPRGRGPLPPSLANQPPRRGEPSSAIPADIEGELQAFQDSGAASGDDFDAVAHQLISGHGSDDGEEEEDNGDAGGLEDEFGETERQRHLRAPVATPLAAESSPVAATAGEILEAVGSLRRKRVKERRENARQPKARISHLKA